MYSIGYVAKKLNLNSSTIRYWESEFSDFLSSLRTKGGQRRYDENLIQKISIIKELLYEKKYTIEGAKKIIKENYQ